MLFRHLIACLIGVFSLSLVSCLSVGNHASLGPAQSGVRKSEVDAPPSHFICWNVHKASDETFTRDLGGLLEDVPKDSGLILCMQEVRSTTFDMIKGLVGLLKDGVKITVLSESGDSGFSLQQFFDDLYAQKGGDAHMTLFGDDNTNNKIAKKVLSPWEITFEKREDYSSYKRKSDAKGM